MSTTPTASILLGLGARILFSTITHQPSDLAFPNTAGAIGDYVVQGLFQGALLHYVFLQFPTFAPVLAFGLVARAILDFSSGNNADKLTVTFVAALVGGAASYILSIAMEDGFADRSVSSPDDRELSVEGEPSPVRNEPRRSRRDINRSRLRQINRNREESPPRRDMSYYTDDTASTMELMGHTGLGRLVDMQLASLRKKAATAEANRRRCKEEKKWAMAQGDRNRATQLTWQIKRYAAMVQSYSREADRKIIEATKARHSVPVPTPSAPQYSYHYNGQPVQPAFGGNTQGAYTQRIPEIQEASQFPNPYSPPRFTREQKGKAPVRGPLAPETITPGPPRYYT